MRRTERGKAMRAGNRTPEQTQPAGPDESGFWSGSRAESAASPPPPRPEAASHCVLPAASQQASCEWRNFPACQPADFSSRSSNVTRALRSCTSITWPRGAMLAGSAAAGRMRRAERSRGGTRRRSGSPWFRLESVTFDPGHSLLGQPFPLGHSTRTQMTSRAATSVDRRYAWCRRCRRAGHSLG